MGIRLNGWFPPVCLPLFGDNDDARLSTSSPRAASESSIAVVVWTLGLLLLTHAVLAQESWMFEKPEDNPVFEAVRRGDYRGAVSVIDRKLRFAHGEERVVLLFQKGDILQTYLDDMATAMRTYEDIARLAKDSDDAHLARIYQARIQARLGNYAEAIAYYRRVAENADEASIYRKTALDAIERTRRAMTEIDAYRQQVAGTTNPYVWTQATFRIASLFDEIGNPTAAIREYEALIRRDRSSELAPEAQFRIGKIHARLRDIAAAMNAYRQVITTFPASRFDAEALFQMGHLQLAEGDPKSALASFDRLLDNHPTFWKSSAAVYMRAVCLERLHRIEDAIDAYRLFINVALMNGQPVAMGDIGRREEEAATLQADLEARIKSLQERLPAMLLAQAKAAMDDKRYADALASLRTLLARYRTTPEGNEGAKLLDRCEAMSEVQSSLEIAQRADDPVSRARARYHAATLYETELRDYDTAITLYQQVAGTTGNVDAWKAQALYRIGAVYVVNLNNIPRGLAAFRRLVHAVPDSNETAKAFYQIGEIYRRDEKSLDDAIVAFESALRAPQLSIYLGDGCEDSTADAAAFRVARVRFENQDEPQKALEALDAFFRTRPNSPRRAAAYLYMSRIYETLNQRERAIDALLRAKSTAESSPVNVQWIRYEFPELSGMTRQAMLEWMDKRLDAVQGRAAKSASR
jgi:tetratricopeptide (TPR) repeat protein